MQRSRESYENFRKIRWSLTRRCLSTGPQLNESFLHIQQNRFVDNRLSEIRRSPAQFRYVDNGSAMTPADLATRGLTIAELRQ
uniref:Uncharacterized protein n=1 Tax=Parascaris equorum TaxID=6256 RepID=A0A914S6C7_PAREQ